MAGIEYERYRLQQVMLGVTPMAKSTWYDHQSTVTVYNRAAGQRLVFCADAAWSHRDYEANQCCWLLLNAENKQIALAVILNAAHVAPVRSQWGDDDAWSRRSGVVMKGESGSLHQHRDDRGGHTSP